MGSNAGSKTDSLLLDWSWCRFLYKLNVTTPDRATAYVSLGHGDDPSGGYRGKNDRASTSHDNKLG